MAYTRIHAIKATVQKALKYICNPEKTDRQILIDSFACGVETAHYDFMDALSKSSGVGNKQMQSKEYAVKGESFGDDSLKYLSFSALGQTRFTRVSEKNFGIGYTKEAIKKRIEKRVKAQEKSPVKKEFPFPKRPDAMRNLIDTDQEKFQENDALKHWADIQNLKIAAASYAEGGSVEELERKMAEKNIAAKAARSEIVDLEHEMKVKAEILKYAKQ